jgi:predicted ferric reductase
MSSFKKTNNLTILNLFYFFKNKENLYDENMINNFIKQLDNNEFWLAGQIKLSQNDFINLEKIEHVKEIIKQRFIDYGPPCNSIEMMSINSSRKQLELIEDMIMTYNKLNK